MYQIWIFEGLLFIYYNEQEKNHDVLKLLFEIEDPEDIPSCCFETKDFAKYGGIVWWNGEQDKKSYKKGSKNPVYLPNLVGEHYSASGLV